MAGAVVLVVAMVVVLPVLLFMAGGAWSALLGQALTADRPPEAAEPGKAEL